jgi:hypothetical protein
VRPVERISFADRADLKSRLFAYSTSEKLACRVIACPNLTDPNNLIKSTEMNQRFPRNYRERPDAFIRRWFPAAFQNVR